MVAAAVGMQVRGWKPFASTLRRVLLARVRLRPHGGDQPREHPALRLARGRLDRRGRPLADGARGSRRVPRGARHDRAVPVRREPDRPARRDRWPTSTGSSSCARPAAEHAGPLRARTRSSRSAAARVVRSSDDDDVTLVGAGITLHEALKAADALAEEGVTARVIDLYSVKPVDEETLRAAAEATGGRFVTVEDHWPEGGLGEAVLSVVRRRRRAAARRAPRRPRDAGLGQARGAARRGRDRRRAHRRRSAEARRSRRPRLIPTPLRLYP